METAPLKNRIKKGLEVHWKSKIVKQKSNKKSNSSINDWKEENIEKDVEDDYFDVVSILISFYY